MGGLLHLAKRFFGSLSNEPPHRAEADWALAHLLDGERDIWNRMDNPDRRHAVTVAQGVAEVLDRSGPGPDEVLGSDGRRAVIAAALLHDSGKVISGFGTPARVFATVVWGLLGRRSAGSVTADRWLATGGRGLRRRLAQYRLHPELGAEMLRDAGSHSITVDWAAQHHIPEDRWTVPVELGRILKDCDDD